MDKKPEESQEATDPLRKAKEDLVNSVSVAGWREALGEPIRWIRRCFQSAVIFLLCCCIYYNYRNIRRFVKTDPYADEINDTYDVESIPASNVTICVQLYMNHTFVMENLDVSQKIIDDYRRTTRQGFDEFYRSLALFFSITARPRTFSANQLRVFSKVMRTNPKLLDFSTFASSAYLPCNRMFKRCWFQGNEFDCCSNAVQSIDDDGICYVFRLNRNADNDQPAPDTFYQTASGPRGGLSVEISAPLDDFPWLDEDAQNGFRVYVDSSLVTPVMSPVTAPHAVETFIKVVPSLHISAAGCSSAGHHTKMKHPEYAYHDPTGVNCGVENLEDMFLEYGGCYLVFYNIRPNSSVVCNSLATYAMFSAITLGSSLAESFTPSLDFEYHMQSEMHRFEKKVTASVEVVRRERCPTHCRYWSYTSVSSFADVIQTSRDHQRTMDAKIHVYYAELAYREYVQTKRKNFYAAFCDFGSVACLCMGMSIVSFFDVFFHVTKYWLVKRRIEKCAKGGSASGDRTMWTRSGKVGPSGSAPEVSVVRDTRV